ncbi:hypothetical protein [Enterobacter hormaechei]|uniref:hypothetical protein n=1 Tax=Enterobacter hormaechei TaxID=158836 RepID=UPI0015C59C3B|nr:hypothetical protein [Enterobacter hormaechei]MBK4382515.1 hypothetical protein [Enterobacter hormaechei]MBK4504946.1 hypothetical protein [Enterobacter hormaechei]MBK4579832.1 hypothetical protein [Enterobacter hormaechei]NYA74837.1 hypothetical protein [Enterobacter hormaechei]
MSIDTKEWLLKTIAELEEERDATPGAINEDATMALAAMKRALASLTAEPDYYVVVTSIGVWQSFCKTKAEAEFIVSKPFNPGYSILEIYTAPPAAELTVRELTMWVKRLAHSLRNAKSGSKLPDDAMACLSAKGLIGVEDALR